MINIFKKNGFEVWKVGYCKFLVLNKIEMIYKYVSSEKEVNKILIKYGLITDDDK